MQMHGEETYMKGNNQNVTNICFWMIYLWEILFYFITLSSIYFL